MLPRSVVHAYANLRAKVTNHSLFVALIEVHNLGGCQRWKMVELFQFFPLLGEVSIACREQTKTDQQLCDPSEAALDQVFQLLVARTKTLEVTGG